MQKRVRAKLDTAVVDLWRREVGDLSSRRFALRIGASEDLVLRLDLYRTLEKHKGCVNTVCFNASGDVLVSGSDDKRITLWDWKNGTAKLMFHSGHHNNVLHAKFMPFSNDGVIVSCGADGQVRRALVHDGGRTETKMLAKHRGRAHRLAIEHGSPHLFYSCGEDGVVHHFDLRSGAPTELFTCRTLTKAIKHLNAIATDPVNPNLFAVAGLGEFALLYDVRMPAPHPLGYFSPDHLIGGDAHVGVTGLAFSPSGELLVSYSDERIYLFAPDTAIAHAACLRLVSGDGTDAAAARTPPSVYEGHQNVHTIKGVGFCGPTAEYVVSGSDCGRIFIWDKKSGRTLRVLEGDTEIVNCIESHPHDAVLASSGIDADVKVWTPRLSSGAPLAVNVPRQGPSHHHHGLWYFSLGETDDDDDYDDDGLHLYGYDDVDSDDEYFEDDCASDDDGDDDEP